MIYVIATNMKTQLTRFVINVIALANTVSVQQEPPNAPSVALDI